MAVSDMKKLSVICTGDEVDDIIKRLIWLSCVDIKQKEYASDDGIVYEKLSETDAQIAENNKLLLKLKASMDLLAAYDCKKWERCMDPSRLKKRLFSPPEIIDVDEFMEAGRYDLTIRRLNKLTYLANQLTNKKEERNAFLSELIRLSPWKNSYDMPLGEKETVFTDINTGIIGPKADIPSLLKSLNPELRIHIELVERDEHASYISIITYKNDTDAALRALYSMGFTSVDFGDRKGYAKDESESIQRSVERIEKEINSIEERIAEMVGTEIQFQTVYDIVSLELVKLKAKKKILKTGSVYIIDGWTPEAASEKIASALDKFMCAYDLSEPEGDADDVPVLLQNNKFASAFEPVVSLYSLPKYKTFDPTFIMSIFYIIMFGLMFADVGYGIILSLGCFAAIKFLYPVGTMKKFFEMFGLCGISCIVMGVLMGGYFGDFPASVLGIEGNIALWFDPITDPMTYLILSLAIGAVHLVTGMVLKMIILIKQGKVLDAIFDVGSWLVLFAGIGVLAVKAEIGMYIALFGALMLVFTQGRKEKNIFLKLGKGLLSLYKITSYASDLLSYSRILALGLASAVIAKVVNVMAMLLGSNAVGYVLMIIILLIGHLMNMAINVLGTFVHASRLQYIEFFGKFYDEGGVPFEALSPENKYVILKNKN